MESKQITLRIPKELHEALEDISNDIGLSVSALLMVAIWNSVQELNWLVK